MKSEEVVPVVPGYPALKADLIFRVKSQNVTTLNFETCIPLITSSMFSGELG